MRESGISNFAQGAYAGDAQGAAPKMNSASFVYFVLWPLHWLAQPVKLCKYSDSPSQLCVAKKNVFPKHIGQTERDQNCDCKSLHHSWTLEWQNILVRNKALSGSSSGLEPQEKEVVKTTPVDSKFFQSFIYGDLRSSVSECCFFSFFGRCWVWNELKRQIEPWFVEFAKRSLTFRWLSTDLKWLVEAWVTLGSITFIELIVCFGFFLGKQPNGHPGNMEKLINIVSRWFWDRAHCCILIMKGTIILNSMTLGVQVPAEHFQSTTQTFQNQKFTAAGQAVLNIGRFFADVNTCFSGFWALWVYASQNLKHWRLKPGSPSLYPPGPVVWSGWLPDWWMANASCLYWA